MRCLPLFYCIFLNFSKYPRWSSGDDAWIGAMDFNEEGTFAWLGIQKLSEGVVFWKNGAAYKGAYTNWKEGEPNEGGVSGKSEDCVAMYGGGDGKWFDKNCYQGNSFFVVEFGPPSIEDEWHGGSLDDDELRRNLRAA